MATHDSIIVGEFHRQRSLAGYSPWGLKESDTTEHARVPPGTKRAPFTQEFYLLLSG